MMTFPLQFSLPDHEVTLVASYHIDIRPVAKQSFRMGKFGGYTPKEQVNYMRVIKEFVGKKWAGPPLKGSLFLSCVFSFKMTKEESSLLTKVNYLLDCKKRDNTNLVKPVEDALIGVCYKDDSQISVSLGIKIRSSSDFLSIAIGTVRQNFAERPR